MTPRDRHSFGYVILDEGPSKEDYLEPWIGYDVDPSVPSELRVDHEEVGRKSRRV